MSARHFLRVMRAEAYKQVRVYWGDPVNLTGEVLYPALHLTTAYYTFRPFIGTDESIRWLPDGSAMSLGAFLLTGFLGYTIFVRLLWAAIGMTDMERFGGTLEIQYLTPANRFALLVGAAVGGLIRVVYLYLAFLAGAMLWAAEWHIAHAGMVAVALLALVVPGIAFGTLMNSRMLFTRDFTAYVSILNPVLGFLGGVRFPVYLLPASIQTLAAVIPLSWSLDVLRRALLEGATLRDVLGSLSLALAVSAACFALGYWNVHRSERLARQRGTLVLY